MRKTKRNSAAITTGLSLLILGVALLVIVATYTMYEKYSVGVPFLSSAVNPLVDVLGVIGLAGLILGAYFQLKRS